MAGKWRDAAGLYDPHGTSANNGPNGNAGVAPTATTDNAPDHTAHDATAATTTIGAECQWQYCAVPEWQWQYDGHVG